RGNVSLTQCNPPREKNKSRNVGFPHFETFLTGSPITYTANGFIATDFLQGNANRYYRSKETGWYLQDKFQVRSNLSISAGLRFDYHGGLTEKNGRIFNFDPSRYSYDATADKITSNGF